MTGTYVNNYKNNKLSQMTSARLISRIYLNNKGKDIK